MLDQEDVGRLCAEGTVDEIRRAIEELVIAKSAIQAQLAGGAANPEYRGPEWRANAGRAVQRKDIHITRLKQRLRELAGDVLPKERERRAQLLTGGPRAIADELQDLIDEGWSVAQLTTVVTGVDAQVLAVLRRDRRPES